MIKIFQNFTVFTDKKMQPWYIFFFTKTERSSVYKTFNKLEWCRIFRSKFKMFSSISFGITVIIIATAENKPKRTHVNDVHTCICSETEHAESTSAVRSRGRLLISPHSLLWHTWIYGLQTGRLDFNTVANSYKLSKKHLHYLLASYCKNSTA